MTLSHTFHTHRELIQHVSLTRSTDRQLFISLIKIQHIDREIYSSPPNVLAEICKRSGEIGILPIEVANEYCSQFFMKRSIFSG